MLLFVFHYSYSEFGRGGGGERMRLETGLAAVPAARDEAPNLPCLVGGATR